MTKTKINDIIDSIIRTTEQEWSQNMKNYIPITQWEIPRYSKKQIDKAGKIISSKDSSLQESVEALEILNNWRSSHAYPLQVITSNLRNNNPNAIVVQRLKRLDSIVGKLQRFPDMSLYRMGDLGGCRVIVDSIEDVYASVQKYKTSRIRHILKRETDYIQNPKESGYRSYHLMYQFQSDTKETYNKNMLIEIQFRTKLQHIWATAIEMMGIYTKTSLKSSMGDKDTLRFFILVSSIFAKMEKMPICPNTSDNYDELIFEIKKIDKQLNIINMLNGISKAINITNKNRMYKNAKYYILILTYCDNSLKIESYKSNEFEIAVETYNNLEKYNTCDVNTVLVSATSFDTLKAAYPNYFTDISEFVDSMRRILA